MSDHNDLAEKIAQAKRRLPLPMLMKQLGLGEHAKKSARCPWHDDQKPSFSVFQGKDGFWHYKCFVCDSLGGDEITLLVKHLNVSRREAIRRYLEMAGFPPSRPPVSREYPESPASLDICVSESPESPVSHVSPVSEGQGLQAELKQLAAHNACTAVSTARKKRFKLVRDLTALEQRLGRKLELDELRTAFNDWYGLSFRFLDSAKSSEDYLAAFLAELGKVRVPTGEGALSKALESVSELSVSDLPAIPCHAAAPASWRRLAALHRELSTASGGKTYFVSYRDAAKAVPGMSHQQAHDITLALVRLGAIKIISKGDARPNGGKAAEFRYLLSPTENAAQQPEVQI